MFARVYLNIDNETLDLQQVLFPTVLFLLIRSACYVEMQLQLLYYVRFAWHWIAGVMFPLVILLNRVLVLLTQCTWKMCSDVQLTKRCCCYLLVCSRNHSANIVYWTVIARHTHGMKNGKLLVVTFRRAFKVRIQFHILLRCIYKKFKKYL